MLRLLCPFLVSMLLWAPAHAGEKPQTPEQAADAVVAAFKASDDAMLKSLATRVEPDPWIVAEVLCHRGESLAAQSFARAGAEKAVANLAAYVASKHAGERDEASRAALRAMEAALRAEAWSNALKAAGGSEPPMLDTVTGIRITSGRGEALAQLGRQREAADAHEDAAVAAAGIGWLRRAAEAWQQVGLARKRSGDLPGSLDAFRRRLELALMLGEDELLLYAHANVADAQVRIGRFEAAVRNGRIALALAEARKDEKAQSLVLVGMAAAERGRGRSDESLSLSERALGISEAGGDVAGAGRALASMAEVYGHRGAQAKALETLQRGLDLATKLGVKIDVARAHGRLGMILDRMGRHADAIQSFGRAMRAFRELAYENGIGETHSNLGTIHYRLGEYAEALTHYERSLGIARRTSARLVPANLYRIGAAQSKLGRDDDALATFGEARTAAAELGLVEFVARSGQAIANIRGKRGDHAGAIAALEESLKVFESRGLITDVVMTLTNIGRMWKYQGDLARAAEAYERGLDCLGGAPEPETLLHALWGLMDTRGRQGRTDEAVRLARRAVGTVLGLSRGLGAKQGASAGDKWAGIFSQGVIASFDKGRAEDLAYFLESGRAASLRSELAGGQSLRSVVLPKALRDDEERAEEAEREAMRKLRRALRRGSRDDVRAARRMHKAALVRTQQLVERMQREAKRGASLTHPVPDSLEVMQSRLSPREALVLYGLTGKLAVALVVQATSIRIVRLADTPELTEAVGSLDASDPGVSGHEAVAALQRLLIDPLQLDASVTRLLVSPVGSLGYVPFSLLTTRQVVYVPSGTTYGVLLEEGQKRGKRILGLGAPDYSQDARLAPLPATRKEIRTVAHEKLLGRKASETSLRRALRKQKRWRAVHLACHGLVDPQRPLHSSLALTPNKQSDGRLTCMDIFRLAIPADLVVLSACETARGKVYKTDGIVGLTRAFMHAGAPRVLCSLWKVDDEATQALMIEFYKRWNPRKGKGVAAAAALKLAQENVRSKAKWKHPYFWAAWVLWGLP